MNELSSTSPPSTSAVSPLSLMEKVTTACANYLMQRSGGDGTHGDSVAALQRRLTKLSTRTTSADFCLSIDINRPECSDCLAKLLDCLSVNESTRPHEIVGLILDVLCELSWSNESVRLGLQSHRFNAIDSVFRLYCECSRAEENTYTEKPLKLLELLTYAWSATDSSSDLLNEIITLCVHKATRVVKDASSRKRLLSILRNLCISNGPARSLICRSVAMGDLMKLCSEMLSKSDPAMVVSALSLLFTCDIARRDNAFERPNAPRTAQLFFNVLQRGDSFMARRYAADLLMYTLAMGGLQKHIVEFRNLAPSLRQVVQLLPDKSLTFRQLIPIYEVLIALCDNSARHEVCSLLSAGPVIDSVLEHASADPRLGTALRAMMLLKRHVQHLSTQPDRLITLATSIADSSALSCLGHPIDSGSASLKQVYSHLQACLELMTELFSTTLSLHSRPASLLACIPLTTCSHLAEFLLQSVARQPMEQQQHSDSNVACSFAVELILQLIDLLAVLSSHSDEHAEYLTRLQNDVRLSNVFARALSSSNSVVIRKALRLHSSMATEGGAEMNNRIATLLAARHDGVEQSPMAMNNPVQPMTNGVYLPHDEQLSPTVSEHDIDAVIQQFKEQLSVTHSTSTASTAGSSDTAALQLIKVYDVKLQQHRSRVEQMQRLLDAKTESLRRADTLLSQYRAHKPDGEIEASQLRVVIPQLEVRLSNLQQAMKIKEEELLQQQTKYESAESANAKLKTDCEAATAQKKVASKRVKELTEQLRLAEVDAKNERDMHATLRHSYGELKERQQAVTKDIQRLEEECETKSEELKRAMTELNTLRDSAEQKDEQLEDFLKTTEELRAMNNRVETELKQMKKQVTELNRDCQRKQASITELQTSKAQLAASLEEKEIAITAIMNAAAASRNKK